MPNQFVAFDYNGYCVSENLGDVLASIGITRQADNNPANTLRFLSAYNVVETSITIGKDTKMRIPRDFPLYISYDAFGVSHESGLRQILRGESGRRPAWLLAYDEKDNRLVCSIKSARERRTGAHAIVEYVLAEGVRKLVKMKLDDRKKELMEAMKGNAELEAKTSLLFSQAFREIDTMKKAEIEKVRGVLAIKTAEISKEKTALEEKLKRADLMPNLPPKAIAKGYVVFKDERGFTTIGKKINVMPKRATGGDLLSKNIDVPVEAIRGYVCANMSGGRINHVYMRNEDLSEWKHGLYHIGSDGRICTGNLSDSKNIYATKTTESVMDVLDSLEKMFETINLTSLLSNGEFPRNYAQGTSLHMVLEYLRTATKLKSPGDKLTTKKECLEQPYRVGAFYEQ